MQGIRNLILKHDCLIFIFSFIVLWNLAFHILIYFPLHQSPDILDYLAMAQLDFDRSPIRCYRVIIPLLAYLLNASAGWLFDLIHPWTFEGDFSLCLSYLLINTTILSFAMVIIARMCRLHVSDYWLLYIVITAAMSSRWSAEIAGLPLVDSLYFACLCCALFGLQYSKWNYLIAAIWIGPWAKEAFIFMVPVILLFCSPFRKRMMVHLILSGVVVFSFRFLFDSWYGRDWFMSISRDLETFSSIGISFRRLLSLHGLYDVFSVIGFWFLLPILIMIWNKKKLLESYSSHARLYGAFLIIVIFQALLSTDLARMLYLAMPIIAVWIAIGLKITKQWINASTDF